MTQMPFNTRSQQYAGTIYDHVQAAQGLSADQRDKYEAMAHKLPVLIRTAGLTQALAFVNTSKEAAHHLLLDHLAVVVGEETRANLLASSRTNELAKYMRLTQKLLTALLWYKRFAQAVIQTTAPVHVGNQANEGGQ
jgi:CRISPR-associated protein Cmr5